MLIDARPPSGKRTLDTTLAASPDIRKRVLYALRSENHSIIAYFPLIGNLHTGSTREEVVDEARRFLRENIRELIEEDILSATSKAEYLGRECFMTKYSNTTSATQIASISTGHEEVIQPMSPAEQESATDLYAGLPPYRPRRRRRHKYHTIKKEYAEQLQTAPEEIDTRSPPIETGQSEEELRRYNLKMEREMRMRLNRKFGSIPEISSIFPDLKPLKSPSHHNPETTNGHDQGGEFFERQWNKPYVPPENPVISRRKREGLHIKRVKQEPLP